MTYAALRPLEGQMQELHVDAWEDTESCSIRVWEILFKRFGV